jgi:hypothetical protein
MPRYAWVLEVRPGYEEEYVRRHQELRGHNKAASGTGRPTDSSTDPGYAGPCRSA